MELPDRNFNSENDSILYSIWDFSHGSFTTLGNRKIDKDSNLHLFLTFIWTESDLGRGLLI